MNNRSSTQPCRPDQVLVPTQEGYGRLANDHAAAWATIHGGSSFLPLCCLGSPIIFSVTWVNRCVFLRESWENYQQNRIMQLYHKQGFQQCCGVPWWAKQENSAKPSEGANESQQLNGQPGNPKQRRHKKKGGFSLPTTSTSQICLKVLSNVASILSSVKICFKSYQIASPLHELDQVQWLRLH